MEDDLDPLLLLPLLNSWYNRGEGGAELPVKFMEAILCVREGRRGTEGYQRAIFFLYIKTV